MVLAHCKAKTGKAVDETKGSTYMPTCSHVDAPSSAAKMDCQQNQWKGVDNNTAPNVSK